ncbi:MAG: hypothetical protein ACRD8Z_25420, partial [Nitrososphaeraceae archaeon]
PNQYAGFSVIVSNTDSSRVYLVFPNIIPLPRVLIIVLLKNEVHRETHMLCMITCRGTAGEIKQQLLEI